jgi:RNA polymerase sigma-70 factor (ECF subfamily)
MTESPTTQASPSANPAAEAPDFDEVELLEQLRSGSDAAFERLLRAYGGRMLAVARRMLGSEEDAQDAVQEAFLSAIKAVGSFAGQSKVGTWLHRIVVNAALMKLRTRRRKPEALIDDLLPKFLDDGHQMQPAVDWQDTADTALMKSETRTLVRSCIERLPEIYRTVLVMRDIEEVDTEETARLLGVTTAVVKTRLHRARLALRTLLDPHFRGDES